MFFDIDPMQIGKYTPYEVMLLAKQKRERETRLFEDNITLAWHTEAFARQKKLPSLSKILKDVRKKQKKTNSAGDAVLKAMAAEQGIIIK